MFDRKRINVAVLLALGAGVTGMAHAQSDDTSTQLDKVVITGSAIKRVDAETPSPVQVITSEDLKKSGMTSISDVLNSITANGAGTLSSNNSEAFAGGASGVALRGLSVGATLTLIDGHRMAPYPLSDDGERQFVDVTNLPFDAIDRVEILKDGASAVYGSDAIAGVVNIILKKEYKGTTINADVGTSEHGGDNTKHASVIHGFGDLDKDGYNAYVSLEARSQSAIMISQRSGQWLNTNWTSLGGNNLTPGIPNIFNAGTAEPLTPYLVGSTTGATQMLGTSPCGAAAATAGCAYANPGQLQPATQNLNLLASLNVKLSDDWDLNFKASVFNAHEAQQGGSAVNGYLDNYPTAANTGATAFGPGQPPVANSGFNGQIIVPAGYAGNTLGQAATLNGVIPGLGAPSLNFDNYAYRFVGDLTGSYAGWDIDASAGYTRETVKTTYNNFVQLQQIQNMVNNGMWSITGVNSSGVLALAAPVFTNFAYDNLMFVELHGSRPLMRLGGGDLSLATGINFVHKSLDNPIPQELATAAVTQSTFDAYAMGREDDSSAFLELAAPFTKQLEVEGAVRFDHYSTYGNSTTPKIGFKFKPDDAIAIRGTVSNGFRAPSPAENGTAGLVFGLGNPIQPDTRPGACPGGGSLPTDISSLCAPLPAYLQGTNKNLKPETSRSATLGLVLEPIKGWSSTIDLYRIAISNQIVSGAELSSYENNPYPYYIPGTTTSYCVFGPGTPGPTEGGGTATSSESISYCNSPYVNANKTTTSGYDLESHYKFGLPNGLGSLYLRAEWTHEMSYVLQANGSNYQLAGTHGPSGVSGDTGNPKDRVTLTASYDHGPLDVTATANYVGSYSVVDSSSGIPTCADALSGTVQFLATGNLPPSSYCKVSSFTSVDLTTRYRFNNGLSLHLGINNLFDKAPPVDIQTYAGSFLPYNPSQHMAGVIGRYFSVGGSYSF